MNISPQTALERTETLMLDMDGTLLDLAFDNYMWKEHVPRQYALSNGMSFEKARDELFARYAAVFGDLDWYCLDHWRERLGLDVMQLHYDLSFRIGFLPGALEFLRTVCERELRVLLVTNAHPDTLKLKDAVTGLGDYVDGMHSAHDFGYSKEQPGFWAAFQEEIGFDPDSTMFVDDSQPVLESARDYGIEMLVTVTQPDSTEPVRPTSGFRGVERVADLLS